MLMRFFITILLCFLFAGLPAAMLAQQPPSSVLSELAKKLVTTQATDAAKKSSVKSSNASSKGNRLNFKTNNSRLLLDEIVIALAQDPTKRAAVKTLLVQGSQAVEAEMRKAGYDNNVAAAFAFFIVSNWSIATGEKVSDAASDAVVRQVQTLFDTPAVNSLSDADKQKFYEYCLYLGTFAMLLQESADNDETRRQVQAIAVNFWKTLLPVEPSSVSITDRGLTVSNSDNLTPSKTIVTENSNTTTATVANSNNGKQSPLTFNSANWKVQGSAEKGLTLTRSVPTVTGGLTATVVVLTGAARAGDPATLCGEFFEEYLRSMLPADVSLARDVKPEVFRRYIGNGLRTAFSAVTFRRSVIINNGSQVTPQEIHLYAVESGGRSIPVLVVLGGFEQRGTVSYPNIDAKVRNEWLEELLGSARGTPSSSPLFTPAELAGSYTLNSSVAGLQYYSAVTGVYAGTAFVSREAKMTLNANGSYQAHFSNVSGVSTINSVYDSRENGKYLLTKDEYGAYLILTDAKPHHKMRLVGLLKMPNGGKVLMTISPTAAPVRVEAITDYVDRYLSKSAQ